MKEEFQVKHFKELCKTKSRYFRNLTRYLYNCAETLNLAYFEDFPPNEETLKLVDDRRPKEARMEPFKKQADGKPKPIRMSKEEREFFNNGAELLLKTDLNEYDSFFILMNYCSFIVVHYNTYAYSDGRIEPNYMNQVEELGYLTSAKAYELIGYWTVKMKEVRRNWRSASKKTSVRLRNKDIVMDLLAANDFRVDRKLILEAQRQIDRGERTVKNLIKEIESDIDSYIEEEFD